MLLRQFFFCNLRAYLVKLIKCQKLVYRCMATVTWLLLSWITFETWIGLSNWKCHLHSLWRPLANRLWTYDFGLTAMMSFGPSNLLGIRALIFIVPSDEWVILVLNERSHSAMLTAVGTLYSQDNEDNAETRQFSSTLQFYLLRECQWRCYAAVMNV